MTAWAFYAGGGLFLAVAVFALWPLWGLELAGEMDPSSAALKMEKERLQNEIRDLEYDLRTGKLSVEDYEGGRQELVLEAVAVMEALDGTGSRANMEAEIENWVAQARGKEKL